jgi:hypothetical protein
VKAGVPSHHYAPEILGPGFQGNCLNYPSCGHIKSRYFQSCQECGFPIFLHTCVITRPQGGWCHVLCPAGTTAGDRARRAAFPVPPEAPPELLDPESRRLWYAQWYEAHVPGSSTTRGFPMPSSEPEPTPTGPEEVRLGKAVVVDPLYAPPGLYDSLEALQAKVRSGMPYPPSALSGQAILVETLDAGLSLYKITFPRRTSCQVWW